MNKEAIKKIKRLVECAEYARGTTEFEKHVLTLLTFLDGLTCGLQENNEENKEE